MLRGLKWVNESYPQLSILIKRSIPRVVKNNSSWMIQRERDHLAEQRPGESARVGCQDGECLLIQDWKPGKGRERRQACDRAAAPMTCRSFRLDSGYNTDQKPLLP